MSELRIVSLRVRYLGRTEPALDEVSATVGGGQVVSVTGSTGAGKSTLCLAAVGLVPRVVRASIAGSVVIGDVDVTRAKASDLAGQVGIVFSAPALQLSASKPTVRDELAFGLENLGRPARADGRAHRRRHGQAWDHAPRRSRSAHLVGR